MPISILYRPSAHALKGGADAAAGGDDACPLAAPAPLLLYAYGSYGHSIDPFFSSHVFSLADRGVVYAIAHVRGGGEMGRAWYELQGKLLAKKNTFSDYIACAEHLVAQGWTAPRRIGAQGGSAGGLLMGVVANERPDLWAGVLAEVPFVDVVTTMSDPYVLRVGQGALRQYTCPLRARAPHSAPPLLALFQHHSADCHRMGRVR